MQLRIPWCLTAAATSTLALAGCGGSRLIKPKAIAFAPTIVGCSGRLTECTSGNARQLREARRAERHSCPQDKPNILIRPDGAPVCIGTLPIAGPTVIGLPVPSAVRARGPRAVAAFASGEAVALRAGCLACHRIGSAGNDGPGADLTHVASRLAPQGIERALVDSAAAMPSFGNLPHDQRRSLVYFLAQLR